MTNISVIGCGRWGPNHIRNFSSLSDSTVVTAVDTQSERLSRISKNFPNVHVEQDYQRVLENSDIDAVVVATPTNTHYAIVRNALLANKHVMCEKPLCQTSQEAEELIELAKERNLILMVGHVFLFNRGILKIKEYLDAGELGTLHYLTAIRTNLGPVRSDVNAAFDLASHDISIFNWFIGESPDFVSAIGGSFLQDGIEDAVFISLKYKDKMFANIQASWLDPKKVRQMSIVGSKKMITWDDLDISSPVAIYDKGANANNEYTDFGEFLRINMWEGDVRLPKVHAEEPLRAQSQHFLNVMKNGTAQRSNGKFALSVVRVLEAISASLKSDGAPVKVKS
jgi:predicted dehydrogenase